MNSGFARGKTEHSHRKKRSITISRNSNFGELASLSNFTLSSHRQGAAWRGAPHPPASSGHFHAAWEAPCQQAAHGVFAHRYLQVKTTAACGHSSLSSPSRSAHNLVPGRNGTFPREETWKEDHLKFCSFWLLPFLRILRARPSFQASKRFTFPPSHSPRIVQTP